MSFNPYSVPMTVLKESLDHSGYTKIGHRYFGIPNDVWKIVNSNGEERHFRAKDKKMAMQIAKAMYPDVWFTSPSNMRY